MIQRKRLFKDRLASKIMFALTIFSVATIFFIIAGLYYRARPILAIKPLSHLLFSSAWQPLKGNFGFLPFIAGTFWVTAVAVVIAIPLSLLSAIYITEYAPRFIKNWISPLIDLLAGIPSIIYGMWAVLVLVPFIRDFLAPRCGYHSSGYSVLAAGIVLAIMILPVIVHISSEIFKSVPRALRQASLSLGATKWQTVKHVVLRKALPGVIAAIVLGLSRALGETMAVLMVAGNVARLPSSVFEPAYPLPALIANNYGEMLSVPLYDSVLLLAALILMGVVVLFNILARLILIKVERKIA